MWQLLKQTWVNDTEAAHSVVLATGSAKINIVWNRRETQCVNRHIITIIIGSGRELAQDYSERMTILLPWK